jgi:predicted phage terminase large subunit-like protein
MTPEQIADNRTDLLTFIKTMFKDRKGSGLLPNWHQEAICNALERVVIGECNRLIINIPPRSGKTEIAVINFIAWCMGNFPDSEFIHASYSKRLATSNTYNTRAMMQHETYQYIFPHTAIKADSSAKDEFRTDHGGIVYATGSDGTITGYGAGKMRETFGGCFPYDELVEAECGPMKIGDIVASGGGIRVWSYNEETGKPELKKVKSTFTNPANHIIEVASLDGRSIRCTPDHEVLTKSGWVSAIHLAKSFNLVDGKTCDLTGFLPCETSIDGDAYNFIRMFWFCVPVSVRKIICDALPSLSEFDLSNNSVADPIFFGEFGSAECAFEYLNDFISGEFCSRSSLKQRECAVADSVLHVVAFCAIRKISESVIGGVSVEMPNFVTIGSLAYKVLSDEVRDVFSSNNPVNGEVDSKVPPAIKRRLQKSDGLSPSDLTGIRDFIQPVGDGDWFPDRVGYVGFHSATYCIEVEDNNNFILSQTGAVVSNCIIIDDPHKAGEANSDTMRNNVIEWFSTTMESRKNRPDTPIIVIMQRLHEDDLSGWLLKGGNGEKWEHLNISAETESGESFWPEQFPIEDLKRKEVSSPYVYAGQYLQRPAPIGGGIFKDEWWQYYSAEPDFKWRGIYADTAMKTKEQNDYSVFQCWGVTANNKIYLIDMIRGKWEAPELLAQGRAFYNKHRQDNNGTLRHMKVEDKASGTGLIQTLKREGVNVMPIQRNIDKVTRAMDSAPSVEAGHVYLPSNGWFVSDILAEATQFPNGSHDDCLDPMMDAVSDMLMADHLSGKLDIRMRF